MVFKPLKLLKPDSTYIVNIEAGPVRKPETLKFKTIPLPGVARVDFYNRGDAVLIFRSPMNFETLFDKIAFSPDAGNFYLEMPDPHTLYIKHIASYRNLYPVQSSLFFKQGITYTLTLKRGAEDVYGNVMTSDYVQTYTPPIPPTPISTPAQPTITGDVQPFINGDLMLSDANAKDTTLLMQVSGEPTVDFELYRLDGARLSNAPLSNAESDYRANYSDYSVQGYFNRGGDPHHQTGNMANLPQPDWIKPQNLIRAWTQTFDAGNVQKALINSSLGGRLPTGLYWLVIRTRGIPTPFQFALTVGTANLTIKRAPRQTLVWVTDLHTTQPIPNTQVTIYNQGIVVAKGATDAKGVFTGNVDLPSESGRYNQQTGEYVKAEPLKSQIVVVANSPGVYGAWFSRDVSNVSSQSGYMHTDRPLYRPGETVYFRGMLRDRFDMSYTVPAPRTVKVRAMNRIDSYYMDNPDAEHKPIYEADLPLSPFGTFDGELKLPTDIQTDEEILIQAESASITIIVKDFRVPEYEVKLTPKNASIIQGDPVNAQVNASYYFGGSVGNARVDWKMTYSPYYFDYRGAGYYSFYDEAWQQNYSSDNNTLDSQIVNADAAGSLLIASDKTAVTEVKPDSTKSSLAPSRYPIQIGIDASVTDESGQIISARTRVVAHPSTVYVGVASDHYFGIAGKPNRLNLIAVSPDSQPVAGQTIDLEITERAWLQNASDQQWQLQIINDQTLQLKTAQDGTISYLFTPPRSGWYRLRARTVDTRGRAFSSTYSFYALGQDLVLPVNGVTNNDKQDNFGLGISMAADRNKYKPGDTAQIVIPAAFKQRATVLVTLERGSIFYYDVVTMNGQTMTYKLPIADAGAPGAFFTVNALRATDAGHPTSNWAYGQLFVEIEPTDRRLSVKVQSSTQTAKPGDEVTLNVNVTDRVGKPVQAEVGLALVDKAVLALVDPNSGSQESAFYEPISRYWNPTITRVSLSALMERLKQPYLPESPEGRGGTADGSGPYELPGALQVRKDFKYTPLWAPHVVTDSSGNASIKVKLPDNLTTWRIDARAVTMDTKVGEAMGEFISNLPLMIRPVAPRFLVVGDQLELAAVINNNTDQAQPIRATLQAKGVHLIDPETQTIMVTASGRARVAWRVVVEDAENVDLTFVALGEGGYQDAAKPSLATGPGGTIPVYHFTTPDVVATSGTLRGAESHTEVIAIPPRLNTGKGELTVRLDPSLAAVATDGFKYLANYPYQCNEQTISKFLPNLYTFRALKSLNLTNPELEANLRAQITDGFDRLVKAQNEDGGWGWWPGQSSDTLITAYVTLGLAQARDAGFIIDAKQIERGLAYLQMNTPQPDISTDWWDLNRQAFILYVRAQAGQIDVDRLKILGEYRLKLSLDARAYLLMIYQRWLPNDDVVKQLLSDLEAHAALGATGVHWEEGETDWWNWGSNTRTTALVLAALIRARPDSPLLPEAVRWLMSIRQEDHWATTQETSWTLIALTDWMMLTGELKGNFSYNVGLNRAPLVSATVTPQTIRDGQVLNIAVKSLLTERANRLTFTHGEGNGVLYYTARLNVQLPASEVKAISRGATIRRDYFLTENPTEPISSATVGDLITVRLTLTVPNSVRYFVVEDPLPAGAESVDPTLLTSTDRGVDNWRKLIRDGGAAWSWGEGYFDRTEYRDAQTNLAASYLPAGTYIHTYQIRANIPGQFQTMPARAYAFYEPEVFGRTTGSLFTVTPASAP